MEKITKNKKKIIFVLLGIVALTMASRLGSVLSPSISKIQQAFPNTDPTKVESIASIGDITSMLSAIIFGYLLQKLTYKKAAIIGSILLIIGGLLPIYFHSSVNQLLIFALVVGFGTGAITTVIPSLTAQTFSGKTLSKMFGINIALEDGFSMLLMFVGGLLAEINWVHNYYVYGAALICLLAAIFFVPNVKPNEESIDETETINSDEVISKNGWILIILTLLLGFISLILGAVLNNKLAEYLNEFHLGGPATAGTALLFLRAASICVGLSIGLINRVLKKNVLAFGYLAFAIGSLIFISFRSVPAVIIGAFIMGSGTSISLSSLPFLLSKLSSKKKYPIIIGSFSAITSLGFAASTWFFKLIVPIYSNNLIIGTFYGVFVIAVIVAAILIFTNFQKKCEKYYLH